MKTIIRTLITAVSLLGLNTQTHADDEAWAALGGFVAGVITGSVIENHRDVHAGVSISVGDPCHTHHRTSCSVCFAPRRGYWRTEHVRIWIPGYWDVVYNHCGDRVRVWKPGRFEHRPRKVWVAYDNHRYDQYKQDYRHDRRDNRRDYDRYDRRRDDDHYRGDGRDRDRGRRG